MLKPSWYAIPALALLIGATGLVTTKTYASPAAAAISQDRDHDRDWDAPPQELNDIERRGFHDGLEGAHRDYDNHRRPDVENRDEYRHPHGPPEEREAYREGFRRGYRVAVHHLWGDRDHGDHDR